MSARMQPPSPTGVRTSRWRLAIALAVVVVGVALVIWWVMARRSAPAPTAGAASLSVTATTARQALWAKSAQASGVIAPWQEAIIGAQSAGLSIASLDVAVGDVVRRGQRLARFDTATLRAEQAQLAAALTQAQALAAQAQANQARALQLKDSGGISEQEVQRYVTEAQTARAQVAAAQAQVEAKRLQVRQADVLAPDDGVISARTATLGAVANNGEELFRLVRQGRLEWRGEFSASQMAQITLGQSVVLLLPDGQRARARVRQIAPLLDTRSRLGTVYADIEPGSPVRGGMYVQGRIELEASPAQVVPAASVVVRDGRSIVFALQQTGAQSKVQLRTVTVGRRQGDEIEILDALHAGDRIVAQGAGLLADGDTVRIVATPSSSASAGGASVHGEAR